MNLVGWRSAAALALILAACGSPTDAERPGPSLGAVGENDDDRAPRYVQVDVTGGAVRIRNLTNETIGYSVFEANLVLVAIFPPCASPNACLSLEPKQTVEVRYEEIAGYHEGAAEAVVNAWNYVQDPQYGRRAGVMTQTRVRL